MTSLRKIWLVLKKIRHRRIITAKSQAVQFDFVDGFFGSDCVGADDERKIILMLAESGVLSITDSHGSPYQADSLNGLRRVFLKLGIKFNLYYVLYLVMNIFLTPLAWVPKKLPYVIFSGLVIPTLIILGFKFSGIQIGPFSFTPPEKDVVVTDSSVQKEAGLIADSIVITGWEDTGDFLGYLSQITSFYQKHQDIYPVEYETYQRQLIEWQDKVVSLKPSDTGVLAGLVQSARSQLRKLSLKPKDESTENDHNKAEH